jgi:hypothetical protein
LGSGAGTCFFCSTSSGDDFLFATAPPVPDALLAARRGRIIAEVWVGGGLLGGLVARVGAGALVGCRWTVEKRLKLTLHQTDHRLRLNITRLRLKVTGFASTLPGFASKLRLKLNYPALPQNHPGFASTCQASPQSHRLRLTLPGFASKSSLRLKVTGFAAG